MKRLAIAVLLTVCVTTGAQTFLHPGGHGYTSGNMVTPLIDGVKTFSHANGLLKMVEASGGYVHLSFWECKADTVLDPADINPATGKPYMLKDRLKKIAEKGYEVKVLLWDPGDYGLAGIKAINEKSKATLEALDKNIEVQLLKHYTIKGSYHEKEMIFATPKEVTVIVGGLNMTNDYRDDKPHAHLSGMPYYYPTMPWHDVAVEICGPSTVPVELDFKLRWDKSRHRLPTAKGPTPVPPMPGRVPVWIGTENQVEGDEGIFHELLERIDKAERCIYLENFGIHEPKLMKALAEKMTKMRAAHMPFDVILMANNPKGDPIYGWLHYTTYCYLSMMGCDSFHYKNNDDKIETITRTPEADKAWGFNYRDDGKKGEGWHKMAQLWWAGPGKTAHATEIIYGDPKFDSPMPLGGNPIYHLVHADPGGSLTDVYVHSKVAIFDDKYAAIGSANFNPRSMFTDSEITAFFSGPKVAAFRAELWGEFGVPSDPAAWRTIAAKNYAADKAGTLPPGALYLLPIGDEEYIKKIPYETGAGFSGSFAFALSRVGMSFVEVLKSYSSYKDW